MRKAGDFEEAGFGTYAHTCDPMSGITVNLAISSLSRTQAIFSSEERAAVNSEIVNRGQHVYLRDSMWEARLTGKSANVL